MSTRSLRGLVGVALLAAALVPLGAAQDSPECFDVDLGRCDLAVSISAAVTPDDKVHVDVLVRNIGEIDSYETTLRVTGRGDWDPYETTVPALASNDRFERGFDLDIPESARDTTAVFVARVTPIRGESEVGPNSDETKVEIAPAQKPPPPDLRPDRLAARVLDDGARVEVFGDVGNLGGATPDPVTVTVSAPGWDSQEQTLAGGIPQESARPFAVTLETPDAQRGASVRFHVAVAPVETEEQTENNARDTDAIDIPGAQQPGGDERPDLVLTRATARVIEAGQRVAVRGAVANRGDATTADLTISVGAPGWGPDSASLGGGLAKGATRSFRLRLSVPDDARGNEVSFHVEVEPVSGEEDVSNNARDTAAVVLPLVEDEGGLDVPWPLVIGGAVALVAALAAAQLVRMRRRRPQAQAGGGTTLGGDEPPPGSAGAVPPSPAARERTVSTGFASEWGPGHPLDPDAPLAPSTPYLFWLEVGEPVLGSIEETPTELPPTLPVGATLTVAVFALDDRLTVTPGADVGELRLEADGRVAVTRAAATELGIPPGSKLDLRRLFFHVRTGERPGTARLRCNIYYEGVLVQARLITAEVQANGERREGALRSTVDYTLAPSLDPARLAELLPHRLSVLINESADGSHDFYFLGERGFKNSASFDGQELQNLIARARGSLRRAAWGDADEWAEGKAYRYEGFNLERLESDLCRFALSGYRFYDAIVNRLAGGYEGVAPLAEMMLRPGLVQIASRESPRRVIPAALIYDYPLDTTAAVDDYELCPTLADALVQQRPLEEVACFRGECPSRSADTVVCASGFWGYRHALGLPVSVAGTAPDLPGEIGYSDGPHLAVAVSTDPAFVLRAGHEQKLRALRAGIDWRYANTRAQALSLLKEGGAEVVYFYCHGGVAEDVPYIQVGPLDERGITRDLLRREAIRWSSPRPLVFINGCHTTALEPERAIEFVSALVENAQASGVIGTEITVFEPLASAFAEECLRRFLDGDPIGEAIRAARLALLAEGNPLALAYIPFATAGLRLRAA